MNLSTARAVMCGLLISGLSACDAVGAFEEGEASDEGVLTEAGIERSAAAGSIHGNSTDFNGDGKADFLLYSGNPANPSKAIHLASKHRFRRPCKGAADGVCGLDAEPYTTHRGTRTILEDFNGDGKTDLFLYSGDPSDPEQALYLSDGGEFYAACKGDTACGLPGADYLYSPRTRVIPGDFNGDGKTDLFVYSGYGHAPYRGIFWSKGDHFMNKCHSRENGSCGISATPYNSNPRTRWLPGDYNGDGKTDLLVISGDRENPGRDLYLAGNGAKFVSSGVSVNGRPRWIEVAPMMFSPRTRMITLDQNGDGKTDLFVYGGSPADPRRVLYISKGTRFARKCRGRAEGVCGVTSDAFAAHPRTRWLPGDYDGDGRADLLVLSGTSKAQALYLAEDGAFRAACGIDTNTACGIPAARFMRSPRTRTITMDQNGDGRTDVLVISGARGLSANMLYRSRGSTFRRVCASNGKNRCGISTGRVVKHPRTTTPSYGDGLPAKVAHGSTFLSGGDLAEAIQHRLDGNYAELILDAYGSLQTYSTGRVDLRGHQDLTIGSHVTVQAHPGAYGIADPVFSLGVVEDITIRGEGNSQIRMNKHEYSGPDGWRHGIGLYGAKNIRIFDLTVADTGGDGIYIGSANESVPYSENVHISQVVCDNASRDAISIVSGSNVLIEKSTLSNTLSEGASTLGPGAGIDFEPDHPYERLENITVRDTALRANEHFGFFAGLAKLDASSRPISIRIENCSEWGSQKASLDVFLGDPPHWDMRGSITVRDTPLFSGLGEEAKRLWRENFPIALTIEWSGQ